MKKLIFIITLLVSTNVYALKQYWCSDEFSASNCNKCQDNGIDLTFKVNVENQVVIQRIQKGMQTQTSSFEKCSVADKKNWVCSTYLSDGKLLKKTTMSDGIFLDLTYNVNREPFIFYCAK